MTTTTSTPGSALHWFLEVWTGELAADVAESLSCVELDALADLLRVHGRDAAAAEWVNAHSRGDDEGDRHYRSPAVALTYGLDELTAAVAHVTLAHEDPDAFGAGHLVLYRHDDPARRLAITERTDKPADDDDREVVGWTCATERRTDAGTWATEDSGTCDGEDADELVERAWQWATG